MDAVQALPAGNYNGTTFNNVGNNGNWWTATADGSFFAWNRGMYYYGAYVGHGDYRQTLGFSVRCLKNTAP